MVSLVSVSQLVESKIPKAAAELELLSSKQAFLANECLKIRAGAK